MRLSLHASAVVTGLALVAASLHASGAVTWTSSTQADFLKGQALGTSIDELGRVAAGPAMSLVHDASAPQVWSLSLGPNGTWVAGTGGDGRVIRGRAGQVTTLLDTTETNVYAVAAAPDGRVFAATGPDGKIYVINADGTSRVLFDPPEKYVWALLVDRAGRLWVGAGTPAVIYTVDATGASKVVYRPSADHVVSLTLDATGRALAGTEGPGRLYRFDAGDRPTALLDTGLAELRSIAVDDDGTIYAAALAGDASNDATASAAASPSSTASATAAPTKRASIFRLRPGGVPDVLWDSLDLIYDIAIGEGGSVLAATGPDGHLFSIRPNGTEVLLNGVDARQITRIVPTHDTAPNAPRYMLASANPGRIHAMGSLNSATAPDAQFLSAPRDAKVTATWGTIRWEATPGVSLFTRSGNTDRPDESWSDWSAAYATAGGSPISSPAARYLQWKAVFGPARTGAAAPSLTSVSIGYLPANTRPSVTSITVYPAGAVFQKPFSDDGVIAGMDDGDAQERRALLGDSATPAPALGRRMYSKGLQTFAWRADDADGDRLTFSLAFRREGDADWHTWKTGQIDPLIVWDTTTVPDGRYTLRVIASDASSNTTGRTLTSERESAAFDVDNTPPVITIAAGTTAGAPLSITVTDAQSPLESVEYAIDGTAFQPLAPVDGVTDSREERYQLTLPPGTALARVMIRATDVMKNVAVKPAR